jgi:exopolyphosphatase / guanosine-5'-triphosphate,3'-diphosphate pyrophosphatase
VIAIDLGSNTIRFLHYDCQQKIQIAEYERAVRTAEGMANNSGNITDEAIARIIDAVTFAKTKMNFEEQSVQAFTTAAFRHANNSHEAIQAIYENTHIKFEIIDPEYEAHLCADAVYGAATMATDIKTLFIVDLGGASTEIIYKSESRTISKSFEMGIVTSATRYGSDYEGLLECIAPTLQQMKTFVDEINSQFGMPDAFASTAGTPTTIAALKLGMDYHSYDKARINTTKLLLCDIKKVFDTLVNLSHEKREAIVGENRGDLILTGIVIFLEIFKTINYEATVVYDDGLREGIAYDYCKETIKKEGL